MKRLYILIGFSFLHAQSEPVNRATFLIDIAATDEEIVIDGERNETVWKNAATAKDFFRITPIDTGLATTRTEDNWFTMTITFLQRLYVTTR